MTQAEQALLIAYLVDAGELDPEGDLEEQFLGWHRVSEETVSGETHYKVVLDAARIKARSEASRKDAGLAWPRARRSWAGTGWRAARAFTASRTIHLPDKVVLDAARIKGRSGVRGGTPGWPGRGRGEAGLGPVGEQPGLSPLHGPCPPGGGLTSRTGGKSRRSGP